MTTDPSPSISLVVVNGITSVGCRTCGDAITLTGVLDPAGDEAWFRASHPKRCGKAGKR